MRGDRVALKHAPQVQGTVIGLLAHDGFVVRFDEWRDETGRMRRGLKITYSAHHARGSTTPERP
jgi:hypothetical protein